ncbi:MAG: FAD-dependent oxidoreductase [Actinomycetota bacterium]|nr:FAD-dependent oxidoreductase [Actinomycetota bacterium]
MAKPVILAVDDDPGVLRAVERDLRNHYAGEYRIVGADSGPTALGVVGELKLRNEAVALFLIDQRMPEMEGVEFLQRAMEIFPSAKRALLTAYADTEAAIDAINRARLDYYIMKPWDPPEERLYPILDDLLYDWQASFRPPFQGIRVVGHRWSRPSHQVKEFLARNQIPYQSVDVESDEEAAHLLKLSSADAARLPVVVFEDGSYMVQPSNMELAERIGLKVHAALPFYDLVIVGAGPAGLAAAVYGASEGLKTLLIEREAPGGQAGQSARIENYLGFPVGLSGADLSRRAVAQARRFGAEILIPLEAAGARRNDPYRIITMSDGSEVSCHALLVTTGVSYRRLAVPGADELTGAGVYYGASRVEAMTHRGEDAFIVGGGNSAGQAAMYLSGFARSVTLLVRSALQESMSQYLIDELEATDNIWVRTRTGVTELKGSDRLEAITLQDLDEGGTEAVAADALFIFIGQMPHTEWVAEVVERDPQGFILSGSDLGTPPPGWSLERSPFPMEASVPGIFVAGDVRHGSIKRIASATGEGAMAVRFVHEHLAGL